MRLLRVLGGLLALAGIYWVLYPENWEEMNSSSIANGRVAGVVFFVIGSVVGALAHSSIMRRETPRF
jgi:drug/metabolite transporter (DMT)-like permease